MNECIKVAQATDTIVLTEDGVYATAGEQHAQLDSFLKAGRLFALSGDIAARGLDTPEDINSISTAEFVTLCTQHNPIQSWF